MADFEEAKLPPVVSELSADVPQTKFEINYKDKDQLVKDVHYVTNHLYPLTKEKYDLKTDISKSGYKLSVIQGGITNLLYLMTPNVKIDANGNVPNKLLVRIYGENTEILIDRKREEKLFYELGTINFGPKMYGIFGNGRMEQFYDNAHAIKLDERKHCKKICKTLAALHSIHPTMLKAERSEPSLWKTMDKWHGIAKDLDFKDDKEKFEKYQALNWQNISKQIGFMKCILPSEKNENDVDKLFNFVIESLSDDESKENVKKALNVDTNRIAFEFMFDAVFTHHDLLGGNILYREDEDEIKFVDFEYGSYNYRAFDFANHFCEYAGFDCDWNKHFPKRKHMKEFVHDYIFALCVNEENKKNVSKDVIDLYMKGKENGKKYDAFLDSCVDVVLVFCCADHYFWGLWGVVQAKYSPIDFDFIQYAHDRIIPGYEHSLTQLPLYFKLVLPK